MARSMLLHRVVCCESALSSAALLALHGRGADLDQLVPLCKRVAPAFRLFVAQAARGNAQAIHGPAPDSQGFTWYFGSDIGHPEPATFGESLWQVEQFVYDLKDGLAEDRQFFLLGFDQGAVLALMLACIVPELLAGVAAVRGFLPEIRGCSPPIEDLKELPVLLVYDPHDGAMPAALVDRTANELRRRRAAVELHAAPGVASNPEGAEDLLRQWLPSS
jgi:predicted esterase